MSPVTLSRSEMTFREMVNRARADLMKDWRELSQAHLDAQPRVYVYGYGVLVRELLPFDWFSSRDAKDEMIARLATIVTVTQASRCAWSTVQYMSPSSVVNLDDLTPEERAAVERNEYPPGVMPPDKQPDRIEVVSLHVFDREIYEGHFAEIKRPKKGSPRLARWNHFLGDDRGPMTMGSGLMIDPIREALR